MGYAISQERENIITAPATFTSDPEDAEDFAAWSERFSLDEREEEIEAVCYDNDVLEAMADRLVSNAVPHEC